jgi:C4-dicarboxylate-binding protein DctP
MKFSLTVMSGLAGLMLTSLTAQAADVTMRISLQLPMKSHLGQNILLFNEQV